MLKYSYNLNLSSNEQLISLDDFYVSPDLLSISGTTENCDIFSQGDTLWIKSPYFPNDLPVKIVEFDTVKRNGYLLIPKKIKINKTSTYSVDRENKSDIYYVELNSNVYFSSGDSKTFVIDDITYSLDDDATYIEVREKNYIENDKVIINGITFNALINSNSQLVLTDMVGQPFNYPSEWVDNDGENTISSASTIVNKLSLGENFLKSIECERVSYGGHRAYIVYGDEKYYIQYFYDTNDNSISVYGVTINNVQYPCDALNTLNYPTSYSTVNIYNINDYAKDVYGNSTMTINGEKYIINFEPCDIYGDEFTKSGIICIETVKSNPPILNNDIIYISPTKNTYNSVVKNDQDGVKYIYFNGKRYDVIPHLCDKVSVGGIDYELTYDDYCSEPYLGLIAKVKNNDNSIMNFMVSYVGNDIIKVKKVEYINGDWVDVYSLVTNNSNISYTTVEYDVTRNDGVLIDNIKHPIYHYENIYAEDSDDEIIEEYDYVKTKFSPKYKLKVINTIGNNKILCVPYINGMFYDDVSINDLSDEILLSVYGNDFIVEKRENVFGVLDLTYENWVNQAAYLNRPTSIYELANVRDNIRIIQKNSYFNLPLGLYKNTSNKLEYDDLIYNQYYDEEADKAINKLVDMEKDMYTPVFMSNGEEKNVNSMIFNLHFRTRDLDTWKLIEDEGSYEKSASTSNNFNSISFENGGINASNGENMPNTETESQKKARSKNNAYLEGPIHISGGTDVFFFLFRYLEDNTFVHTFGPINEITLLNGRYKYRVVLGHSENIFNEYIRSAPYGDNLRNLTTVVNGDVLRVEGTVDDNSRKTLLTIKSLKKPTSILPLTANYQYCNYFITDYYPYNGYYGIKPCKLWIPWRDGSISDIDGTDVDDSTHYRSNRFLFAPLTIKNLSDGKNNRFSISLYKKENTNKFCGYYHSGFDDGVNEIELVDTRYFYKIVLSSEPKNYEITTKSDESFYSKGFSEVIDNSDLLGFMYFTTDDVKRCADKLNKSFLRLTFFDSKNPETQNMLGTSTLYFDTKRYLDVVDGLYEKTNPKGNIFHYETTAKSRQIDRSYGVSDYDVIDISDGIRNKYPTVLDEVFKVNVSNDGTMICTGLDNLQLGLSEAKLDSRIIVKDSNHSDVCSEGFYAYILKAFADKKHEQTIYMKAEFFHAGVGIKIPMTIPTKKEDEYDSQYNAISTWNENDYNNFIKGYDYDSVYNRLYIPIKIKYDENLRKFIYFISDENGFSTAIQRNENGTNDLIFNLFELKIKPQ